MGVDTGTLTKIDAYPKAAKSNSASAGRGVAGIGRARVRGASVKWRNEADGILLLGELTD